MEQTKSKKEHIQAVAPAVLVALLRHPEYASQAFTDIGRKGLSDLAVNLALTLTASVDSAFPESADQEAESDGDELPHLSEAMARRQRELIKKALERAHGNITKAATMLGVKRPRLSQMMQHHNIILSTPSR